MHSGIWTWCARGLIWWIRRNPLYLISAACMAVGARLYLVHPDTYAGDTGLILLTLGILQAYKWMVSGILLLLHRSRRCPEDEHSLLLVAALFWTGPIAATVELSAHQARQGLVLALGVLAFALIELFVVRRTLAVRMSVAGRALSAACLALLVVTPYRLHVDTADGTDELFLYFAWWSLAGTALLATGAVRYHLPTATGLQRGTGTAAFRELAFITIVLAATATHLHAMNYAFVGHARLFYASPLLLAVAVAGFIAAGRIVRHRGWIATVASCLPVIAVGSAVRGFAPEVPAHLLPGWPRDPLLVMLALAGVTYWVGARQTRSGLLLHAGNLALVGAGYRCLTTLMPGTLPSTAAGIRVTLTPDAAALALLILAAYLFAVAYLRQSRIDVFLGIMVVQPAAWLAVWETPSVAPFFVGTVTCWGLLAVMHLSERRPSLAVVLWPLTVLLALSWHTDFDVELASAARLHIGLIVFALLAFGLLWPNTHYRWAALAVTLASAAFYACRGVALGAVSPATAIVSTSFMLLLVGAGISWNKPALLGLSHAVRPQEDADS